MVYVLEAEEMWHTDFCVFSEMIIVINKSSTFVEKILTFIFYKCRIKTRTSSTNVEKGVRT